MSHQLMQSAIIAQAKLWAGRKGQNVDATGARESFDTILQDITKEFNCLPATATGNLTLAQSYILLPEDYWDERLVETNYAGDLSSLKVNGIWMDLMSPSESIYYYDLTETGTPTKYAVEQDPVNKRILIHPHLAAGAAALAYEFLYFKLHPFSWIPWTGTSGTDISFDAATKTIAQVAAGFNVEACKAGRKLTVSGSASNDGTYTIVSATTAAVVVAEALANEAAGANITITVQSEGEYLHLYGERWDPAIVQGVAWKIAEIVKERGVADKLQGTYERMRDDLGKQATKAPKVMRVIGTYF